MFRLVMVIATAVLSLDGASCQAATADNPVVCALVRDVIKKELSARHSKEKGWRHDNTWIWLDNPSANLAVDVGNLTLENGRFTIEGRAACIIQFQHRVDMLLGNKTIGGQALVYVSFNASAQVGETLRGSKVNINRLEINQLRLRGDAARPLEQITQAAVKAVVRHKKGDIEQRLEESLNRINLAGLVGAGRELSLVNPTDKCALRADAQSSAE